MDREKAHLKIKTKIKLISKDSAVSIRIKSRHHYVPLGMSGFPLTLYNLLTQFYLKEWIQEDLKEMGISSTGSKEELIFRLLDAHSARNNTVQELGTNLISTLPFTDLKSLARYVDVKLSTSKKKLIESILEQVTFEPYTDSVDRVCNTCKRNTKQILHFDNNWNQNRFECTVCGLTYSIDEMIRNANGIDLNGEKFQSNQSQAEKTTSGTLISMGFGIFFSLLFSLKVYFIWSVSLVFSFVISLLSILGLVALKPYWEKYIELLINKFSKN